MPSWSQAVRRCRPLLLAAGLLAAPATPAAAAPPPGHAVAWLRANGDVAVAVIADDWYRQVRQRRRAALEPACGQVAPAVAALADHRLTPIAEAVKQRVPDLGTWMFAWTLTFDRDRQFLADGFGAAYQKISAGDLSTAWAAVRDRFHERIQEAVRTTMLEPAAADAQADSAWLALSADTDLLWQRLAADHDAAIAALLDTLVPAPSPAPPGSAEWLSLLGSALPDPVSEVGGNGAPAAEPAAELASLTENSNATAISRAPRPIVTKAVSLGLRRSVGLSTLGVTRLVVDSTEWGLVAYVPGVMLGLGGAIVTGLGLDFTVTHADEALNRPAFEANVTQSVTQAFDVLAMEWTIRQAERVSRRCQAALAG